MSSIGTSQYFISCISSSLQKRIHWRLRRGYQAQGYWQSIWDILMPGGAENSKGPGEVFRHPLAIRKECDKFDKAWTPWEYSGGHGHLHNLARHPSHNIHRLWGWRILPGGRFRQGRLLHARLNRLSPRLNRWIRWKFRSRHRDRPRKFDSQGRHGTRENEPSIRRIQKMEQRRIMKVTDNSASIGSFNEGGSYISPNRIVLLNNSSSFKR